MYRRRGGIARSPFRYRYCNVPHYSTDHFITQGRPKGPRMAHGPPIFSRYPPVLSVIVNPQEYVTNQPNRPKQPTGKIPLQDSLPPETIITSLPLICRSLPLVFFSSSESTHFQKKCALKLQVLYHPVSLGTYPAFPLPLSTQ